MINNCHVEGVIYQHKLELKTSGPNSANPGTQYITGTVEVATNSEITNIVSVHFTYVTSKNKAFDTLKGILDRQYKNYMADGAMADKISIDTSIGLNEFYSDRTGKVELVSAKRNEGGFVHIVNALDPDEAKRDAFETDIVITNVREVDADPERNTPAKAVIRGVIFDYRNSILPVEYDVIDPRAISYFVGLEASPSNPVFTKVRGRQISEVINKEYREESAFGEDYVRVVKSSRRAWVVNWVASEPYEWDSEETILASELKTAMSDREVYLATLKKRQDDYKASKSQAPTATVNGAVFNF